MEKRERILVLLHGVGLQESGSELRAFLTQKNLDSAPSGGSPGPTEKLELSQTELSSNTEHPDSEGTEEPQETLFAAEEEEAKKPPPHSGVEFQTKGHWFGGFVYPLLDFPPGSHWSRVYEVPWGDVMKVRSGTLGFLRHVLLLVAAMTKHGTRHACKSRGATAVLEVYRVLFEAFLVWAPLIAYMTLTSIAYKPGDGIKAFYATALVAVVMVGASIYFGWSTSPFYFVGVAWALVTLLEIGFLSKNHEILSRIGVYTTSASMGLAAVFLVTAVGTVFLCGPDTMLQKLAFAGFLYFPYIVLSGISSGLTAFTLAKLVDTNSQGYKTWVKVYTSSIPFDLAKVEHSMTVAIGTIGGVALLGALIYLVRYWRGYKKSGQWARGALKAVLVVSPISLILATASIFSAWGEPTGSDLFNVYMKSATRLAPFLAFLLPGLNQIVDRIGDLVFYWSESKGVSTKMALIQRLQTLLEGMPSTAEVVIVAHSWGSVVAYDTLATQSLRGWTPDDFEKRLVLATCGSPLQTLIEFLAKRTEGEVSCAWHNFYREGDYVGDEILDFDELKDRNKSLPGAGTHTDYFADPRLWDEVVKLKPGRTEPPPGGAGTT